MDKRPGLFRTYGEAAVAGGTLLLFYLWLFWTVDAVLWSLTP